MAPGVEEKRRRTSCQLDCKIEKKQTGGEIVEVSLTKGLSDTAAKHLEVNQCRPNLHSRGGVAFRLYLELMRPVNENFSI